MQNPFVNKQFGLGMGPHSSVVKKQQDPAVVRDLRVTLEEVLSGCTKKMKVSRKRLNPDGRTGWKEGTKITFPKEGDETPTNIPADVVFVLKDKPHQVFKRDGSDIIYTAKISLRDRRGAAISQTARSARRPHSGV
uniref:DnaJ heat shock protein family (Hsp40) member B1b n=1 Tax=Sphaeramia orbicularis TaxID=375764 RepID=A0A673B4L9_9TELE